VTTIKGAKDKSVNREKSKENTSAFIAFLKTEAAGGIILLFVTAVSVLLAQFPVGANLKHFWHLSAAYNFSGHAFSFSIEEFINDFLMAIFFFVIGLEVKREIAVGELRSPSQALIPIVAAIGGMVVPASIFLILQKGTPAASGWGIPMATDIAFVVGAMSLLSKRVPLGLRVILLSLAIVDDIGAVLVIAFGYTSKVYFEWLVLASLSTLLIIYFTRKAFKNIFVYALLGLIVWLSFFFSGVHATVAGVLLGLIVPAHPRQDNSSVAESLQHALHPWVSFGIMPLFAFANAGVEIDFVKLFSPLSVAVALGLMIGKPLGIVSASYLVVKLGFAKMPAGVNLLKMIAAGSLAGIGFTMALFITSLALSIELMPEAKVGVLMGSLLSAILGIGLFLLSKKVSPQAS